MEQTIGGGRSSEHLRLLQRAVGLRVVVEQRGSRWHVRLLRGQAAGEGTSVGVHAREARNVRVEDRAGGHLWVSYTWLRRDRRPSHVVGHVRWRAAPPDRADAARRRAGDAGVGRGRRESGRTNAVLVLWGPREAAVRQLGPWAANTSAAAAREVLGRTR